MAAGMIVWYELYLDDVQHSANGVVDLLPDAKVTKLQEAVHARYAALLPRHHPTLLWVFRPGSPRSEWKAANALDGNEELRRFQSAPRLPAAQRRFIMYARPLAGERAFHAASEAKFRYQLRNEISGSFPLLSLRGKVALPSNADVTDLHQAVLTNETRALPPGYPHDRLSVYPPGSTERQWSDPEAAADGGQSVSSVLALAAPGAANKTLVVIARPHPPPAASAASSSSGGERRRPEVASPVAKRLRTDVATEFSQQLSQYLQATLITADLEASIDDFHFPRAAFHGPSPIVELQVRDTLHALGPQPDFSATIGTLCPPRIVLRPHLNTLLKELRDSLVAKMFKGNRVRVYGGVMGGGMSTTLLVARYFFTLAHGLVIAVPARRFTSGTAPLPVLVGEWLRSIATDPSQASKLRSIPYKGSSSLLDLIAVAADHQELSLFIFQTFISELKSQRSVPLLLVVDEYDAFLGTGKLLEYDDERQQYSVRNHVNAEENAVARTLEWNTFKLEYGTALFGLSSSASGPLNTNSDHQCAVTRLEPLSMEEVRAFQRSLQPALVEPELSAAVENVMARTAGVAREVSRLLIEFKGDSDRYDRVATQAYRSKFYNLLTSEGSADFDVSVRSSLSIIMAGLHLHFPVTFASIPVTWTDSGILALGTDGRTAQFVCPAQERAVNDAFYEMGHAVVKQAVHFLESGASAPWHGLHLAVAKVVHNSGRLTVQYFSIAGLPNPEKDRLIFAPNFRFMETPKVSRTPYRDHNTRLPHLFTHRIASPAAYPTVYDFYSRCSDSSFQVGSKPRKLRDNEFYVYITSSAQGAKQVTEEEKAVYCIGAAQLKMAIGEDLAQLFYAPEQRRCA